MTPETARPTTFGILIYTDVEPLDFCGPYNVFSTTRIDEETRRESESPIKVVLISETLEPVVTAGGMRILPDVDFVTCPPLDVLIVPGGHGTRALMGNQRYLDFVNTQASKVEHIASVATGSLVLGAAGLLNGRSATTHWRSRDLFRSKFPTTTLQRELRVVIDGPIMTCSSIAAGIEMSLALVSQYYGDEVARNAAMQMEYTYPETAGHRRGTLVGV